MDYWDGKRVLLWREIQRESGCARIFIQVCLSTYIQTQSFSCGYSVRAVCRTFSQRPCCPRIFIKSPDVANILSEPVVNIKTKSCCEWIIRQSPVAGDIQAEQCCRYSDGVLLFWIFRQSLRRIFLLCIDSQKKSCCVRILKKDSIVVNI